METTMIMPTVMKFGGTSVADAQAFENVERIVSTRITSAPVVIVSAMSGVTDALLASTRTAKDRQSEQAIASLETTFRRHRETAAELLTNEFALKYSNVV